MKKIYKNLILIASALALVGCSTTNAHSESNSNPTNSSTEASKPTTAPSTEPSITPSIKPSTKPSTKPSINEDSNSKPKPEIVKLNTSFETKKKAIPEVISAYTDGIYSYYMINLGTIFNIPLENATSEGYFGADYELTLTSSESNKEVISEKIDIITKASTTWNHNFNANASVDYKNLSGSIKANLNVAYDMKYNKTMENINEEHIEQAISSSKSKERKVKITLDSSFKHGYYRNILVDDADIIANVVKSNTDENDYHITTIPVFKGTLANIFEYSETKEFKVDLNNVFSLDYSYVKGLQVPKDPLIPNDDGYQKGFYCGDGSEAFPYIIKERPANGKVENKTPEEQFLMIENFPNKNFKLATDLNFESYAPNIKKGVTALIDKNFTGVFDGNGHTIKNLTLKIEPSTIRSTPESDFDLHHEIALFRRVDGDVKNFTIDKFNIEFPIYHDYRGEQFGFAFVAGCGTGKINNVTIKNSNVRVERNSSIVGSIASVFLGEINSCNVINVNIMGNGDLGGLVGFLKGNGKIQNSKFVHSKIEYIMHVDIKSVGGIASNIRDKAEIYNSTSINNTYDISADNAFYLSPNVGCIVGDAQSGTIQGCNFDKIGRRVTTLINRSGIFSMYDGLCGRVDKAKIIR